MTFEELPVRSWFVFQAHRDDRQRDNLPVGACMKVQGTLPEQAKYFVLLGTGVMQFLADRNVPVRPLNSMNYAGIAGVMAADLAPDRTNFQLPTTVQGDNS